MKNNTLKTFFLTLITLVLVACGGDDSPPTPPQRVVNSNVKFTGSSGAVTIRDYALTYNADNMVSTYQYFGGSPYTVRDETINYNINKKVSKTAGKTFEYDANDRIVKITEDGIRERESFETTFIYDDVGKVIRANGKRLENGVDGDRANTRFAYTNGVLTKITTTYTYDSGVTGSTYTTDLTYDASGNISRIVQTSGSSGRETVRTINLTYDTLNEIGYNLAKTSGWLLNNQSASLIPIFGGSNTGLFNELRSIYVGYTSMFFYAKNNVLTKERIVEYQNVVNRRELSTYSYTYNGANYPLTVNESYTYERTGRPTTTSTIETTYTYEDY